MASTPSPTAARARTPPTPRHGPRYDDYEPFSPRRSKRTTAHTNPYSSFNNERGDIDVSPVAPKRASLVRTATQLSSPPSSPVSPAHVRSPRSTHKTPRKVNPTSSRFARTTGEAHSDSDGGANILTGRSVQSIAALPTPSKTPRKRTAAVASTARILSFQPVDPNDVMPPRRAAKYRTGMHVSDFEVYEEGSRRKGDKIEIFTDASARIPEMDGSDDNPFNGPPKTTRNVQSRRAARLTQAERSNNARMEQAVRRGEGVTYTFRGKKVYRRFDQTEHDQTSNSGSDIGDSQEQRSLRHQIGASADRAFTRSAIKPRLLFPSAEQIEARKQAEADEEAPTDIDVEMAEPAALPEHITKTPISKRFTKPVSPPTTIRRSTRSKTSPVPLDIPSHDDEEDDDEAGESAIPSVSSSFPSHTVRRNKKSSPFDAWPRTKAGKRRASMGSSSNAGSSGAKRARGEVIHGPEI